MNLSYLIDQCYNKLPYEMKTEPWKVTDHGRKVLLTEDELNAYIAAYGEMHIVKCRAALQNFPFKDLEMYSFEIFDWGCGQGLATLSLLEMLYDRKMLSRLNRIVLIEPSTAALTRAHKWVAEFAGPGVEILVLNKYIPNSDIKDFAELSCSSQVSINLFSNILDIRTINLSWLASKVASLAPLNYVVCVGPKFVQNSNTRISDFCGYFNPTVYFSNINQYPYEFTSKTHHAYGCETKCFLHKRTNAINTNYQECADENINTDPYDATISETGDLVVDFCNKVSFECKKSFDVFIRPNINCDSVDAIAISKTRGIVLINVCTDLSTIDAAFNQIETIKENLFNIHLKSLKIDSITFSSVYNCVKTALYFPNNSIEEVEIAVSALNEKRNSIGRKKNPETWSDKDFYAYNYWFTKSKPFKEIFDKIYSKGFKYEYYEELTSLISSNWHSFRNGDTNTKLSPRQQELVNSDKNRLRVKGIAGSGKTHVVANRAVSQHIKTGKKVLILTYNITLMQYIRMRILQVPEDFSPSMFEIINYHQFFKSKANRYSKKSLTLDDFDDSKFFDPYRKEIEKYQTIIIDEVQDFKTPWLQSIVNNFLAKDGSISVFGDGEQNIYNRELEEETRMPPIIGCGFSGRWNETSERVSLRIINPMIASLSSKFAQEFVSVDSIPIEVQQDISFENYNLHYWNVDKNTTATALTGNILWIMEKFRLNPKDVVILGQSINLLRYIEESYSHSTKQKTMISFETMSQYQAIIKNTSPTYIQKDLSEVRRAAKTHFTTSTDSLKLSTIHSFKGWESKDVILLLQPEMKNDEHYEGFYIHERENTPALIYTALTRAKCNLFIVNIGNPIYHNFFRNNVK